ncbi:MAG: hypothetical protein KA715_01440 [Xanthomonadaceae bacterium]|nr:hypothetical protein [Xanthomonadaceae bacterium]
MKSSVMVVNSVLLMMMAALTLFQTGCTPITPSLDRRLFVPKKEPVPGTGSENSLNLVKEDSKDPIYRDASLNFDHDAYMIEFDDLETLEESDSCKNTELDIDTVELFRKDGKLELELERPLDTEFSFEVSLPKSDTKVFAHNKKVSVKLSPTGVPNIWVFELSDKQEQKLVEKVEVNAKRIQWSVCPTAFRASKKLQDDKEDIAHKIGTKGLSVL